MSVHTLVRLEKELFFKTFCHPLCTVELRGSTTKNQESRMGADLSNEQSTFPPQPVQTLPPYHKVMDPRGLTYQALVVRQHDDDLCIVIPNHPPEILGGVRQRVLGYNKLIAPVIAL